MKLLIETGHEGPTCEGCRWDNGGCPFGSRAKNISPYPDDPYAAHIVFPRHDLCIEAEKRAKEGK